ncbi:MAG: hypothetical protein CVU57_20025 [Deltaproteobacteria bacterium HGW-Deltaproteobacteria-15]|nr:MAG: hypothetical protein CVU57_20025 [Deltaproteobacteria bacterium HGW-Deltaproteobacteria-15]
MGGCLTANGSAPEMRCNYSFQLNYKQSRFVIQYRIFRIFILEEVWFFDARDPNAQKSAFHGIKYETY